MWNASSLSVPVLGIPRDKTSIVIQIKDGKIESINLSNYSSPDKRDERLAALLKQAIETIAKMLDTGKGFNTTLDIETTEPKEKQIYGGDTKLLT